jgi:uncharacterized protein YlxP (DUF503 family)
MVVGIARLSLLFGHSGSLKEKRSSLRRIIDRTRKKYNVAVAEVDAQDSWQNAVIALCVVGNEVRHVQSMLDRIVSFIEDLYLGQVIDSEQEILHYSDEESLGDELGWSGEHEHDA